MSQSLPPLTPRNQTLVDLAVRYGILFIDAVQRLLPRMSSEASRKALDRLVESGWFAKHHFADNTPYYVLSSSACYRLELKRDGRALRQGALIKRVMLLLHFSSRPTLRLLTSAECREHLQGVYHRGPAQFFIDTESSSLGWVYLDMGRPPHRVYMKIRSVAAERRLNEAIRQLSADGRFRMLLLTTTECKAEQLRELFAARPIVGVPVEVAADELTIPLALIPTEGDRL